MLVGRDAALKSTIPTIWVKLVLALTTYGGGPGGADTWVNFSPPNVLPALGMCTLAVVLVGHPRLLPVRGTPQIGPKSGYEVTEHPE